MVSNRGFVLPTIAILLLIMSLVVSSLLFRSLNRTTQVIGERNQQVIYNAATPAIDRAKAKLEYLFRQDIRLPGGLPSDEFMADMLRNQGAIAKPVIDIDPSTTGNQNPYDFPGEERLNLDGNNNTLENAWSFQIDTNGDGNLETVAYSILSNTGITDGTTDPRQQSDAVKAPQLIVRNGPINLQARNSNACQGLLNALTPTNLSSNERQWDAINNAVARRAFQVTALVINDQNQANRTVATLEMQQDRQASRGNRWGAWFRNDLEIFPGPLFRWNGAMHTEGNLIIGGTSFQSFLISSPASCLFTRDSSEITVGGDISESAPPYLGQIITGTIRDNNYNGSSRVHLFNPSGTNGHTDTPLNNTLDSVIDSNPPNLADISLDPVVLFTTDRNENRNGEKANTSVRDLTWKEKDIYKAGRIFNRSAQAPYVDDTYRADDRYGPKAVYNSVIRPFFNEDGTPTGKKSGQLIPDTDPFYTPLTNLSTVSPENQGLDGYWERRAWAEGLRVIVGQRLDLGNAFGWLGNNDPLYPPIPGAASTSHEQRQWKTLRDNLAAVQATAIYHSAGNTTTNDSNGRFPRACLATTAHPGTQATINNSTNFAPITFTTATTATTVGTSTTRVVTDFLSGRGTNGWEFDPPADNEDDFEDAIASTEPLGIALRNLAHLAGDGAADGSSDFTNANKNFGHYGAFPPMQDTAATPAVSSVGVRVHPAPTLTMWGNTSNLRRAIHQLDSGTSYDDLSLADKTTLQTAACTLGMLAYNIDNLQDFDYVNNRTTLESIDAALAGSSLPASATPDTYISAMESYSDPAIQLLAPFARLIHQKEQVTRDRRMGFSWNITPAPPDSYRVRFITATTGFQYRGVTYRSTTTTNIYRDVALDFDPDATIIPNVSRFLGAAGTNGTLDTAAEEQEFIRRARSGVKYVVRFVDDLTVGDRTYDKDAPVPTAPPYNYTTNTTRFLTLDFDPVQNGYLGAAGANNTIDNVTEEQNFIRRALNANPQYVLRFVNDTNTSDLADDFLYGGIRYDLSPDNTDPDPTPNDAFPNETNILSLGFDPVTNNYFGYGSPTNANEERRFIRLAISLGALRNQSRVAQAKFPALFYLFPVVTHEHDGTATSTAVTSNANATIPQPTTESYVTETYIFNRAVSDDVNDGYNYKILRDSGTINDIEDRDTNGNVVALEDGVGAIAILPRITARWSALTNLPSTTAWVLPNTDTITNRVNTITDNGTPVGVAFLDKGIYNGRERMGVRVLDFDLDLLRRNPIGDQSWLPDSGIIYSFREDGVREDGIARPLAATTTWTDCNSASKIVSSSCLMNATSTTPVDPPINPDTGISPKPVDFYADPDRRPFGFRLRNGADLRRIPDPPTDFQFRGLAFISDNPVYIQGDSNGVFNQHQAGNNRIEEFTELLGSNNDGTDWNDFYTRTGINTDFATTNDAWRPAEIIADAITITSSNFVDGSIVEGIRGQLQTGRSDSSYRNINAPGTTNRSWLREDGRNTNDINYPIPVRINRNGFPLFNAAETANTNFGGGRTLIAALDNTRINATIVSGTVASRANQSYGGMHNFPRFIENWGNRNLHISGAFIQLNFSTSATAPFDHDAWEPGSPPVAKFDPDDPNDTGEAIPYYGAPLRRWGYDVGLQYSPAGPVARRFAAPNNTRSEFYRELPIEDPYVRLLRCAKKPDGTRIDSQLTCP